MAVASYKTAIRWLAANDDNEWLRDEKPMTSITASLVQDLWGRTDGQIRTDLLSDLRHIHPNSWHGKLPWEEK